MAFFIGQKSERLETCWVSKIVGQQNTGTSSTCKVQGKVLHFNKENVSIYLKDQQFLKTWIINPPTRLWGKKIHVSFFFLGCNFFHTKFSTESLRDWKVNSPPPLLLPYVLQSLVCDPGFHVAGLQNTEINSHIRMDVFQGAGISHLVLWHRNILRMFGALRSQKNLIIHWQCLSQIRFPVFQELEL